MNGPFNHALQDHPQSRLRRLLLLHGIVVWTHLKSTALIKNIGPRTASLTQTFASFCTKAGSADDESQTHLRGRPGLLPVLEPRNFGISGVESRSRHRRLTSARTSSRWLAISSMSVQGRPVSSCRAPHISNSRSTGARSIPFSVNR